MDQQENITDTNPRGEDSGTFAPMEGNHPHRGSRHGLPSVTNNADVPEDGEAEEGEEAAETDNDSEVKLVLPAVAGLALDNAAPEGKEQRRGKEGFAESIILDGDEGEENEAEFFLPRIEVNPMGNLTETGLPTWNNEFESMVLCRKPRKEIIAENAHPHCFGSVGAAGLSRVFTSGSFCPDMSSLSAAPKNHLKYNSSDPLNTHSSALANETARPVERSKTIAHIPSRSKNKTLKIPEITASKVSLFSRDGELARNLVFVPNARMTRDDRAKSDLEAVGSKVDKFKSTPRGGGMPKLAGRRRLINPHEAAMRSKDIREESVQPPESESDELTPSEEAIMGTKINDWFTKDMGPEDTGSKPKGKRGARNKRKSRNIWDPGMQRRIHRGLASSVSKLNTCIGNYLNDVTASRFPRVEIRQIVFTR